MPINPSIAGSAITPQEPIDLLGSLGKVAAIKHYQAQAAEQQRKQHKAQQIEALASQYPDPEDFIAAAHKIDPMFAAEFGKRHEEAKTAKLKTYQEGLAAEGKTVDRYLRLLQASDDDPKAYGIVRQGLVQASQDYDAVLPTPEQWADPTVRARVFSMGDTIANSLKTKQAATEAFLKGDYRRGLAEAVSGAPNLQVARSYLEEARGVAPKGDIQYVEGILASMPDFSSAQQVLKQGALTADQQRQGEQFSATNTLARETLENTKSHQADQLGIDKQRLGLERQRVGLEGQRVQLARQEANKPAGSEVTKLPAAIAEKVAGVEQSMSALSDLKRLKKDAWLGPIDGWATKKRISLPGLSVPPDLGEFAAQTSTLKNAVIKATTGAAMSEPEAQRIMEQIPDFTDKPDMWIQKANATEKNLELLRRRMLELSGVPQSAPIAPGATASKADPLGIR